jgi:hypothetical protein
MSLRFDIQCFLLDHAEEVEKYGGVVLAINVPGVSEPFIYLERAGNPKKYLEKILKDIDRLFKYPWGDAVLDLEYTKRLFLYLDWIDEFDVGESISFTSKLPTSKNKEPLFVLERITVKEGDSPLETLRRILFESVYGHQTKEIYISFDT